jgi:hypothetical protein
MPAPTLTSISPNVGGTVGGAAVTLTGTNFSTATGVTIGGVACTSFVAVSNTSITCVTPAGSAGDASVVVTNPDGSNGANSLWIYLPTVPSDIYVYLKGGRGDGFVPGYTGAYVDSTVIEKSPGYRNAAQSIAAGAVYPGVLTAFSIPAANPYIVTNAGTFTGTPNDIAANTPPRQWDRNVTWRRYIGAGGIEYPYRLDQIIGLSSKKRGL